MTLTEACALDLHGACWRHACHCVCHDEHPVTRRRSIQHYLRTARYYAVVPLYFAAHLRTCWRAHDHWTDDVREAWSVALGRDLDD